MPPLVSDNLKRAELETFTSPAEATPTGVVLVVDDNNLTLAAHRAMLAKQYRVVTAASGEEALTLCQSEAPDLVLLDIEMPGLDGIETCRQLRATTDIPVIFATAHNSLDVHIQASDAGGNDIIVKPANADILARKVSLAIRQHREKSRLVSENQSLQQMAMGFLSSMGDSGNLLNFMRDGIRCATHQSLARHLFDSLSGLGVRCSLMLKYGAETTFLTSHGEASPLERSILEHTASLGRIFQFKQRLVVNYPRVSIIVTNMPDEAAESERAGKIRDNVAILAETTDQLGEGIETRLALAREVEWRRLALDDGGEAVAALRRKYLVMLGGSRLVLQEILDKMNKAVAWLGATREEEARIGADLNQSVRTLLTMLAEGGDFEASFDQVLETLRRGPEHRDTGAT